MVVAWLGKGNSNPNPNKTTSVEKSYKLFWLIIELERSTDHVHTFYK